MQLKTLILALAVLPLTAQAAVNIQRWKTKEGTQILLVEHHENPIVDMAVSFKGAGSAFDPQNKSEVSEFTAALLTSGTKQLDEEAFNARTNDIAANLASVSDLETSSVEMRSLSKPSVLKQSAALFNAALTRPRFDSAAFTRLQKQGITTLQQQITPLQSLVIHTAAQGAAAGIERVRPFHDVDVAHQFRVDGQARTVEIAVTGIQ